MKKSILLIACFFLAPLSAAAQPVVQFDHPTYDFSVISQEETVEHTFEFTNKGDQELIIEQVTPS